jgi:hypothetical protein
VPSLLGNEETIECYTGVYMRRPLRYVPSVQPCERRDLCSLVVTGTVPKPAPARVTLVVATPSDQLLLLHLQMLTMPVKAPVPPGGTKLPSPDSPVSGPIP